MSINIILFLSHCHVYSKMSYMCTHVNKYAYIYPSIFLPIYPSMHPHISCTHARTIFLSHITRNLLRTMMLLVNEGHTNESVCVPCGLSCSCSLSRSLSATLCLAHTTPLFCARPFFVKTPPLPTPTPLLSSTRAPWHLHARP